jgi:hypothetical protein
MGYEKADYVNKYEKYLSSDSLTKEGQNKILP